MGIVVGLGDKQATLCLYTPHRPPLPRYRDLAGFSPAPPGETRAVIAETGNHWRKIFSIFAKLHTALSRPTENGNGEAKEQRWQTVRDEQLFTAGSGTALLFENRLLPVKDAVHIIGGKDWAARFDLPPTVAIDPEGRLQHTGNCYLTPYLDYRQFPNALIDLLVAHIRANR